MVNRRSKVRIFLSMVDPEDSGKRTVGEASDPFALDYTVPIQARNRLSEDCLRCGRRHDILFIVKRVPVEMFDGFPVFKINGSKVIVDATLPTGVIKLPRDAKRVQPESAAAIWHGTSDLHEFGASDPAPPSEW